MEEIDLALIDGGHGFPIPFIDWLYIARILRPGGILLVDDTQLWTGYVLKRFLRKDPAWRYLGEMDTKTAIFEKLHNKMIVEEWCYQPFIIGQQRWLSVLYQVRRMWSYLRCGKFDKIIDAVGRRTIKLFKK